MILQGAALGTELAFIVEGTRPRSNLLKKFIHEQESGNLVEESTFPKLNHHPQFVISESLLNTNLCEFYENEKEKYCIFNGIRYCEIK